MATSATISFDVEIRGEQRMGKFGFKETKNKDHGMVSQEAEEYALD